MTPAAARGGGIALVQSADQRPSALLGFALADAFVFVNIRFHQVGHLVGIHLATLAVTHLRAGEKQLLCAFGKLFAQN